MPDHSLNPLRRGQLSRFYSPEICARTEHLMVAQIKKDCTPSHSWSFNGPIEGSLPSAFVVVGCFAPDEERLVLLKLVVQFHFTYGVPRSFLYIKL